MREGKIVAGVCPILGLSIGLVMEEGNRVENKDIFGTPTIYRSKVQVLE